jgi:exonuclease III
MVLINVYAPHSELTKTKPELTNAFYEKLQQTYDRYKTKGAIVLVLGDLNARIGSKKSELEIHLGAHTKRYSARNANGHILSDY